MENKENKLVSVIIPCFNQAQFISDAINSVLKQTYKNIEIIVVDDCSKDNSKNIINEFCNQNNNIIFIQNKENKGVIYSRNIAIDSAKGDYILPLDGDDIIEQSYIEKAVKILNENSKIGIVYSKARMFGAINKNWDLPEYNKENILFGNCIFNCALFRKSDFIKAGKYKEYMKDGAEDWDLWLSFIELGIEPYRINEVLFNYRQFDDSTRTTSCAKNLKDIWRTLVKNHINLYIDNDKFVDFNKINEIEKLKKKVSKYKKLFNIALIILILFILMIGGIVINASNISIDANI